MKCLQILTLDEKVSEFRLPKETLERSRVIAELFETLPESEDCVEFPIDENVSAKLISMLFEPPSEGFLKKLDSLSDEKVFSLFRIAQNLDLTHQIATYDPETNTIASGQISKYINNEFFGDEEFPEENELEGSFLQTIALEKLLARDRRQIKRFYGYLPLRYIEGHPWIFFFSLPDFYKEKTTIYEREIGKALVPANVWYALNLDTNDSAFWKPAFDGLISRDPRGYSQFPKDPNYNAMLCFEPFLQKRTNINNLYASTNGCIPAIKSLEDSDVSDASFWSALTNQSEFYFALPFKNVVGGIFMAARNGNTEMLRRIIDLKPVNSPVYGGLFGSQYAPLDSTPLIEASQNGRLEALRILLKSGLYDVDFRGDLNETALMKASRQGYVEIVRELLRSNALVNPKNKKGKSAIVIATENGRTNVVNALLEYRIDIDSTDSDGNTPLIIAAGKGNLPLTKFLLEKGANKTIKNSSGNNAWFAALTAENENLARFIDSY